MRTEVNAGHPLGYHNPSTPGRFMYLLHSDGDIKQNLKIMTNTYVVFMWNAFLVFVLTNSGRVNPGMNLRSHWWSTFVRVSALNNDTKSY